LDGQAAAGTSMILSMRGTTDRKTRKFTNSWACQKKNIRCGWAIPTVFRQLRAPVAKACRFPMWSGHGPAGAPTAPGNSAGSALLTHAAADGVWPNSPVHSPRDDQKTEYASSSALRVLAALV